MGNRKQETSPERQLGLTVKHHREARGWSQRDLADRMTRNGLRMTQSQVAKTEGGDRPVRLNEATAYAEVFGLTVEQITSPPGIRPALEAAGELVRYRYRELTSATLELLIAQRQFVELRMFLFKRGRVPRDEELPYITEIESMTIEQLLEDIEKRQTKGGR